MAIRSGRLQKPCSYCEKSFIPATRFSRICEKCKKERFRLRDIKVAKINAMKRIKI